MKKLLATLKTCDFIIIAIGLILAVFFIIGHGSGDGRLKKLVLVSGNEIIQLKWEDAAYSIYDITGKRMIIEVQGSAGRARVLSSDCPDKICIKEGWISECGHIAACLPNGVMLMIDCTGDLNVSKPK